ncbi:MAG: oxidoreductase [Thalassobius sp.]|nr:oxidoreductase [Thalassovita sp.]
MKKNNRRSFVKKLTAGTVASTMLPHLISANDGSNEIIPLKKYPKVSANDKVRVGLIGTGIMGFSNCSTTLQCPGVELAGACDLYGDRLLRIKELYGKDLYTTTKYEELLDRDDIDAVIISTTDHWHDKITIEALNKGKHVYCEKPMVHKLEEGQAVIDTQSKTGKVLQIGSQRVSSIMHKKAAELYKEGKIGQLVMVETWNDRQSALGAWQYSIPPNFTEKDIDWKRYLGDAPKVAFDPLRFFRWRNYQDYGTGVAGDLFVHLFSGLHVTLNSQGPERIFATGGLRYWKDGRDVPDVIIGSYDYPEAPTHPAFNVQMRVNFIDGSGGGSMLRLIGSEGVMTLGWNSITITNSKMSEAPGYGGWDTFHTYSEQTQKEFKEWYDAKYPASKFKMQEPTELVYKIPEGYSDHFDHHMSFYDGIRNNTPIVEDASFGLRAAGPALASNVSIFEKKIVNWDPNKMMMV